MSVPKASINKNSYVLIIDKICSEIIAAHTLADTIPAIVDYEELMDRVRRAEYGN